MEPLERERAMAILLARQAGQILLDIYATDFAVESKGKEGPVTLADRRANEFLVRRLREEFPGDGVVAEESPDRSDALGKRRCWYIDPLDGTKEYVAKNGEFAVMIGLAIDGEARLGVVYQPSEHRLFHGAVEAGAILEERAGERPLAVSEIREPSQLALIVSRSHRSQATDELVRRLGITRENASGSVGLKIGWLSARRADLYVHLSDHTWAWDTCGPEAVLRAAGGRFTDLAGDPMRYGGADLQNHRGVLACNAAAFDAVLPTVRAIATETGLLRGDGA